MGRSSPPCQGGAIHYTKNVRGSRKLEGGYAFTYGATTTVRCGRNGARWSRSTCRVHASAAGFLMRAGRTGAQEQPGGEQINEPNRSRRTYQDCEALANDPPLFSSLWDEAYIGSGENDKRYRRHQPASWPRGTACRHLSLQFQPIQSGSHARYPITTTVQP